MTTETVNTFLTTFVGVALTAAFVFAIGFYALKNRPTPGELESKLVQGLLSVMLIIVGFLFGNAGVTTVKEQNTQLSAQNQKLETKNDQLKSITSATQATEVLKDKALEQIEKSAKEQPNSPVSGEILKELSDLKRSSQIIQQINLSPGTNAPDSELPQTSPGTEPGQ